MYRIVKSPFGRLLEATRDDELGLKTLGKNTFLIKGKAMMISAFFAGIAGSAFCASCLAPLFAFFGIGFSGVIFTLQYRFYFVAIIVAFMLVAIYLTSRKIVGVCEDCK